MFDEADNRYLDCINNVAHGMIRALHIQRSNLTSSTLIRDSSHIFYMLMFTH